MWFYAWVPIVVAYYCIGAYLSKSTNNSTAIWWLYVLFVWNALGIWPIVAKYSKNLLFDAMLYDAICLFAYYVTLLSLGDAKTLSIYQWVGCIMVLVGMILFKI